MPSLVGVCLSLPFKLQILLIIRGKQNENLRSGRTAVQPCVFLSETQTLTTESPLSVYLTVMMRRQVLQKFKVFSTGHGQKHGECLKLKMYCSKDTLLGSPPQSPPHFEHSRGLRNGYFLKPFCTLSCRCISSVLFHQCSVVPAQGPASV